MAIIDNEKLIKEAEDSLRKNQIFLEDELIAKPFYRDFAYRFCWNSNSLEGNTLSLEETIEAIDFDTVHGGHTYSEYTEAKFLYQAIQRHLLDGKKTITEDWIKKCNATLMGTKGSYRTKDLYVGTLVEAIYYPPEHGEVPELMENYVKMLGHKPEEVHFLEWVAEQHILFERIHPFPDGNGRTGRMILNQQLMNQGYLPITFVNQSKYRQAFKTYDRNKDTSLMVYLIAKGEINAVKNIETLMKAKEKRKDKQKRNCR